MSYVFYLDGIILPITPSKLQMKINGNNETVNLINDGEINLIKAPKLTDITFDCMIPQVNQYPFDMAAYIEQRDEKELTDLTRQNKRLRSSQEKNDIQRKKSQKSIDDTFNHLMVSKERIKAEERDLAVLIEERKNGTINEENFLIQSQKINQQIGILRKEAAQNENQLIQERQRLKSLEQEIEKVKKEMDIIKKRQKERNTTNPGVYYLGLFEKLQLSKSPFEFVVIRKNPSGRSLFDTAMDVTLEDYSIHEDAEDGFDIMVSVSLKQYRQYGSKKIVIKKDTNQIKQVKQTDNKKEVSKTYTVKKGDTLYLIAKKQLNDGSKWKKIYELNKSVIEEAAKKHGKKSSSKGHWIYAGTKLKLPKG